VNAVPQFCPSRRELDDVELLGHGALASLSGFEDAGGAVTLQVPGEVGDRARQAGSLEIVDPEGVPLATVTVEDTYAAGEWTGIAGAVQPLTHAEFGAFRRLYLSPEQVAATYPPATLTVPVTGPLTSDDVVTIGAAAEGAPVLLLALVGAGTPAGLSGVGLIRATRAAAGLVPDAHVVAVPLAARDDTACDERLREQVVQAYAPGRVQEPSGEGELSDEVAAVVEFDRPPPARQGLVVFFTGLSGSGKSTLARGLHDLLLENGQRTVTSLDGDVVRRNLSAGLGFSREDRETNIRRIGWVAAEIARHGGVALCSPIAPFDATRKQVREMVEAAGGAFVLVHVATPLAECEQRDRKGLYARARRGEIPEFTGISSPYEEPDDAIVTVDTTGRSVHAALDDVLAVLYGQGWLLPGTDGTDADD